MHQSNFKPTLAVFRAPYKKHANAISECQPRLLSTECGPWTIAITTILYYYDLLSNTTWKKGKETNSRVRGYSSRIVRAAGAYLEIFHRGKGWGGVAHEIKTVIVACRTGGNHFREVMSHDDPRRLRDNVST